MEQLEYKFGIGDTVRLIKRPDDCVYGDYNSDQLPDKIYEIGGVGWIMKEPGTFEKIYHLKVNQFDKYLSYRNEIKEDEIESVGESHPFVDEDIEFKTIYGDPISIGTNVYTDIFFGSEDDWYIGYNFCFVRYGRVVSLKKFNNGAYIRKSVKIVTTVDGKYNDDNSYELYNVSSSVSDNLGDELISTLLVDPKKFIYDYIDRLREMRCGKILTDETNTDHHVVKSWLCHMGIYEDVLSCYNSRYNKDRTKKITRVKKLSNTMHNKKLKGLEKLNKFVNSLSENELLKLKQMLNCNKDKDAI